MSWCMNEDYSIKNTHEGPCYCGISGVRVWENSLYALLLHVPKDADLNACGSTIQH